MHNLVASVFKILGISIISMAVLDTSLVVVDTLSVHNKIVAQSNVMQNEIARNNCVPNTIEPLFTSQLNSVVSQSNIATGVKSNLNGNVTIDGTSYNSIGEDNVKDYGETQTLAISVEMSPTRIAGVGRGQAGSNDGSFLTKKRGFKYNLDYVYTVPCLRYLK